MSDSQPNFWKGVQAFHSSANAFVDAGFYVWYVIRPGGGLLVQPFVAPNVTVDGFNKVVQPFLDQLKALNLTYSMDKPTAYPSFYDLYRSLFSLTDDVGTNTLMGGRLFSKTDVAKNDGAIVDAIRAVVEAGHPYGGHMVNPGRAVPDPTSSISSAHPVWRDSADSSLWVYAADKCLAGASRQKAFDGVTHGVADALRKASPSSAVYVNEVSHLADQTRERDEVPLKPVGDRVTSTSPTGKTLSGGATIRSCTTSRPNTIRMGSSGLNRRRARRNGSYRMR